MLDNSTDLKDFPEEGFAQQALRFGGLSFRLDTPTTKGSTVNEEEMIAQARAAIKPTDSLELVRAFEHLASFQWEYGTRKSIIDGWEKGDRFGEHEYIDPRSVSDRLNDDRSTILPNRDMSRAVRRRKAGPWEKVEA